MLNIAIRLLSIIALSLAATWAYAQQYPSPTFNNVTVNGSANFKGSTSGTTVLHPSATASGTLTLPAATDTLVGKATTDTLTNKTITDNQTNYTRTETGAALLTDAVRWQNYAITPQDFNASAGTGGDDSAALNAAAAAASSATGPNAGVLYLPPPPSGAYNVCADSFRPQKVTNGAASLVIRGPAGGGATIRSMPGCSSGAVLFATMQIEGEAFSENVKSTTKLTFENVRIDGSCLSRYTVFNAYSVGLTFRNSVLRNAATGNGANYFQQSGYETSIDNSNRLENINDAGHTCYNTSADLPDYNLWLTGTDNQIGAVAVDAKIANFFGAGGGNNHFVGTHGWGYPGGTDGQPNLRPQFNYLMEGNQVLIGTIGDQPTVAGIRLQNTIGDNSGAIISGHTITGPLEATVKGVSLGNGVNRSTIVGNNLAFTAGANAIVADGTIDSTNIILNNQGAVLTSQLTLSGLGGTTNQTLGLVCDASHCFFSSTPAQGSSFSNNSYAVSGSNGQHIFTVNGTTVDTISLVGNFAGVPNILKGYTLASGASQLPACISALNRAFAWVSDFATAPTYRQTVTPGTGGGGTIGNTVACDGTNWLAH